MERTLDQRGVMKPRTTARSRFTWMAVALFVAFVVGGSGASSRHERVLYGALPLGLALLCFGRVWWLYGVEVVSRQTFVWLFRRYTGRQAVRFGYGMKAGGVAFALLGAWTLAIWMMESAEGLQRAAPTPQGLISTAMPMPRDPLGVPPSCPVRLMYITCTSGSAVG